jgi:putative ABC transport system permease protein
VPHTIVGVAPAGFFGTFVGYQFQFWVPASMQETLDPGGYKLEDRGARWIEGFVRLKAGVTPQQAQNEIANVARQLEAEYPATNRGRGIRLLPIWQSPFNPMETLLPTLVIALAVAVAVLLITCANVGNLLLLKSLGRRRELTIRLAVGAGRGRLVRQLATEGLVLTAIATVGGVLFAHACRGALVLAFPPRGGVVMRLPAEIDWRVLATSVGVSLLSTLSFALVPATLIRKIDLVDTLKSGGGTVVGSRGSGRVRSALVLVQIAISFLLVAGAGLVMQSLNQMSRISPGFSADAVLMTSVDLAAAGYDLGRARVFQDELLRRLTSLGGVESAAFVRVTPFSYRTYSAGTIAVDGYEVATGQAPTIEYDEVGPGYLATMGIPLVSGREFTAADDESAGPVAVVNETMAAEYWGGADPVGRRLLVKGRAMRVVGVARTSKYQNLLETPKPFFYVPLRQGGLGQGLVIRTSLGPEAMRTALGREVRALDSGLAPSEIITMREQVRRTGATQMMAVRLLGIFGTIAVLLAAVGLYGVMSFAVSQSTPEFGLRLALGARGSDLLWLVMSHGLGLAAAGVAVGAAAGLEVTRLLGSLLYRVSPRDPLTFGASVALMLAVSLAACFLPAWRATRTDPLLALRG